MGARNRHTAYEQSSEKSAVFRKAGRIEMAHRALRLVYTAFKQEHEAYIACSDLQRLLKGGAVVDVVQVRTGIDGEPIIDHIGTAQQSRSGKALMVRTSTSDGELIASWANFLDVLQGRKASTILSRLLLGGS
jgi:hypothetical protein